MMKIVFYTKLNRLWLENIQALRKDFVEVDFITEKEQIDNEIENANAIVGGDITLELIQRAKNLDMVFVPYAGINALPLKHLRDRGVRVANVHGNAPYVAERCIAMALAFYGKIIDYHNDLRDSQWHGYWARGSVSDTWDSIHGKTCAVIGVGQIGKYLAKYLKVFGCRVVGFKKRPLPGPLQYFDEITLDLNEALEKSELVFVTLPLTDETKGMFSAEILGKMTGKFLVNVGRGEIVDEEGLYRSLKQGTLKGAGIDVWYTYPKKGETAVNPSRFPIPELPNVVLSPHLAGFTPQAARVNILQTFENIKAYIKTGKATFEVDPDLMY